MNKINELSAVIGYKLHTEKLRDFDPEIRKILFTYIVHVNDTTFKFEDFKVNFGYSTQG